MNTTKTRTLINLVINTQAWCDEYGVEESEVVADVQSYISNTIREHLREMGVLAE